MKTLKTMVVAAFLGVGLSNCGPDVTNNYYSGAGKKPVGGNGSYTCYDVGLSAQWCMSQPGWDDSKDTGPDFVDFIEKGCIKKGVDQTCIDCLATADCDPVGRKSTFNFCVESGDCANYY